MEHIKQIIFITYTTTCFDLSQVILRFTVGFLEHAEEEMYII
jgi:hypothetical protein